MAIRKSIEFSVSKTGISPSTYQNIGIQSDHNVSEVVFNLDQDLYHSLTKNAIGDILYRFDGYTASGEMKSSEYYSLPFENTPLIYSINEWLTHSGGDVKVVLVITDISNGKTHFEFNAPPALLRFSYKPESVGEASDSVESLTTLARNAEIAANLAEAAAVSADTSNASAVASASSARESAQAAKMEAEVAASYSISAGDFSGEAVMSADKARASEESAVESERIANEHRISAENASASASESKEKAEAAAKKAESIVGEIGILNSASGESILLTDSSNNKFKGLTVYGKSTQEGTPTPESPIDIVSAGASGSVEVKVCGANLFNANCEYDPLHYKSSAEVLENGRIIKATSGLEPWSMICAPLSLVSGLTYTVAFDSITSPTASSLAIRRGKSNDTVVQLNPNQKSHTFTAEKGVEYYVYFIANSTGNTLTEPVTATYEGVRIVAGDTALPFEPYITEQTLTLATPNELRAVGDYADYIDLEKGVRVQNYAKRVYTGEETVKVSGYDFVFTIEQLDCDYTKPVICSHFTYNPIVNATYFHVTVSSYSKAIVFVFGNEPSEIITTAKDTAQAKAWFKAQYDNGTPVIVYYHLAEPIETPLTAEELAYYKALHTNYPNTTIFNSDGTNMDVSYIADTKLYIDNKFAELQALALEG